jgi:hypothetical protein
LFVALALSLVGFAALRPIGGRVEAADTAPARVTLASIGPEASENPIPADEARAPVAERRVLGLNAAVTTVEDVSGERSHAPSATCTVSGTVALLGGVEGPLRIQCSRESDSHPRPGEAAAVDASGAFGPLAIAVTDEVTLRVRLEGGNAAVEERLVQARPGQHLVVDFRPELGTDVWFQIVDDRDDGLLPGGEVEVRWDADGLFTGTFAASDADGYALVTGCAATTINIEARAPGYGTVRLGPWALPEAAEFTNVVRLRPARSLSGQVVHAGAPVEDFELTWWPADNHLDAHVRRFRGAPDGTFELADAPLMDVVLVASAVGRAPGPPVVHAAASEERVLLSLADGVRGRGRVVDGATGEPVANAIVQPFLTELSSPVAPFGQPLPVGRNGEFEHDAFASGRSRVRVSAPGYAVRWVETRGQTGETIDFGLVALGSRQALEVRLVADTPLEPADFWMWAHGDEDLSERPFGAGGVLVFPDVSSGVYHLQVNSVHGLALEHTVVLEPGETWSVGIPVGGARGLTVEVDTGAYEHVDGLVVVAELPAPRGLRSVQQQLSLPPEGRVTFGGVLPGSYTVRVASADGVIASRSGVIASADRDVHLALSLDTPRTTFRVVDARGQSVEGAWVGVVRADDRTAGGGAVTGVDGTCEMVGLEPGLHHAATSHDQLGTRYAIPVEVRGVTGESIELRLAAELHVEVQLLDGEHALSGVHCRLWDPLENNALPPVTTDTSGLARWNRLAEGSYRVRVSGPGVFDTVATVESRADELPTTVAVRRTGSLELRVVAPSGLSIPAATVELGAHGFAASVAEWVAAERVQSSHPGLRTDGQGRLTLEGLPRGEYACHVRTPSGASVNVTLSVRAGESSRALVTVP